MPVRHKDRSKGYIFTINPQSREDEEHFKALKAVVAKCNETLAPTGKRVTISKTPRGKLEQHAWKYNNRFRHNDKRRWRLEDYAEIDLYVVVRNRSR